jgi:hypothetical protein
MRGQRPLGAGTSFKRACFGHHIRPYSLDSGAELWRPFLLNPRAGRNLTGIACGNIASRYAKD